MFEKTPVAEKSWRGALKRLSLRLKNYPMLYSFCRHMFYALKKIKRFILGRAKPPVKYKISKKQRMAEQAAVFDKSIKFSILVPLYNTPKKFLAEMIRSVQNQTYGDWQLCMADGSDSEHAYVGEYVKSLNDARISYVKLQKNGGISENTNACIKLATGEFIALFDHDDLLHPSALYEMTRAICEQNADFVYTDEVTFVGNDTADISIYNFKPDFAPDFLRSNNYICHFSAFSKQLLDMVGGFNSEYDGSQDHDMILRLTEKAKKIVHIKKALYFWRSHKLSVASDVSAKPYVVTAAKNALKAHIDRLGLEGEVVEGLWPSTYKINYKIKGEPLISVIIPNKDHIDDLKKCLDSVYEKSTYKNFEIIIVENNSTEKATFDYYKVLKEKYSNLKVITWDSGFNYSAINNFAVKQAKGEYILLLNNDIEIITPNWIEEMLMFAQRQDVAAVGAKLYYPDDTIQHAGVILGLGGVASHAHLHFDRKSPGYMARAMLIQNLSACTAACLLVKREAYDKVGGLDEGYAVAFNDVDFCMKLRKAGYLIVFTPYAECYHYESKSRGYEDTPEKRKRFDGEIMRFQERWAKELKEGDPYYNPNLTLGKEDFSLKY